MPSLFPIPVRGVLVATLAILLAAVAGFTGSGSAQSSQRLNFVTCPIVRDTATLPCWLAEHQGELYYLGTQGSTSSSFYPPQLLHDVLVEATVGEGPRICGGLPLTMVDVSVLPEINRACNTTLPAEPGFTAPPSPPAPIPAFPDTTREFAVPYDFDSDYITLHTSRIALEAVRIAKAVGTDSIEIYGRRGATRLFDGRVLIERTDMGEIRATKMAAVLRGLGLPAASLHATWQRDVDPDSVGDRAGRHLTIRLR